MRGEAGRMLEAVWRHAGDSLLLVDVAEGTVVDANPRAVALFGRSEEALRALRIGDLHPDVQADRPGAMVEMEITRADGTRVPVEFGHGTFLSDEGRVMAVESFRDVSERIRAEAGARRLAWAMSAVNRAALAVAAAGAEPDAMRSLCEGLTGDKFIMAWIGLALDDDAHTVLIAAKAGSALAYLDGLVVSWADVPDGRGPTGTAVRESRTVVNNDPQSNPAFARWAERARMHGIRSSMATPLVREGRTFAALTVYSDQTHAFTPEVVRLLEDLARGLVVGLEARRHRDAYEAEVSANLEHIARHRAALEQMVAALASTIEKRDPYTAGHQKAVCELAEAVARELGWDEDRCRAVYLAGLVHDIGKISVPSEILNKPGKLLPVEFELVKLHPAAGHEILSGVDFPWALADITRQHHERLDGSGYPDGLVGDEILAEAQVIAAADVFEAMSSHRPYRPALGPEAALAELRRLGNGLLRADIVSAALRVFSR